jgi:hypothetical protein
MKCHGFVHFQTNEWAILIEANLVLYFSSNMKQVQKL